MIMDFSSAEEIKNEAHPVSYGSMCAMMFLLFFLTSSILHPQWHLGGNQSGRLSHAVHANKEPFSHFLSSLSLSFFLLSALILTMIRNGVVHGGLYIHIRP